MRGSRRARGRADRRGSARFTAGRRPVRSVPMATRDLAALVNGLTGDDLADDPDRAANLLADLASSASFADDCRTVGQRLVSAGRYRLAKDLVRRLREREAGGATAERSDAAKRPAEGGRPARLRHADELLASLTELKYGPPATDDERPVGEEQSSSQRRRIEVVQMLPTLAESVDEDDAKTSKWALKVPLGDLALTQPRGRPLSGF